MTKFVKKDLEFLAPNTQVQKLEQIDPLLIKEIEQNAVDRFIENLNLTSLFQNGEVEGGLKTFLPWISAGLLIFNIILTMFK